jgi:hypothetical protein
MAAEAHLSGGGKLSVVCLDQKGSDWNHFQLSLNFFLFRPFFYLIWLDYNEKHFECSRPSDVIQMSNLFVYLRGKEEKQPL